jgi:hypothetical protein
VTGNDPEHYGADEHCEHLVGGGRERRQRQRVNEEREGGREEQAAAPPPLLEALLRRAERAGVHAATPPRRCSWENGFTGRELTCFPRQVQTAGA